MEKNKTTYFILIVCTTIELACTEDEAKNLSAFTVLGRILNGQRSENCEFSGIVHINGGTGFICAGNLIDNNFVLSAAHCVEGQQGSLADLMISMGSNTRSRTTMNRRVSQVIVHEDFQYDSGNYYNDIALLKFSKPIQFKYCIEPVTLPKSEDVYNRSCISAGWGRTLNTTINDELQYALTPLLSNFFCLLDRLRHGYLVKPFHLCTGTENSNGGRTCAGDSGGPLYCKNQKNELVLLGITSFGEEDCEEGYSYYSSVSFFSDWIAKKTQLFNMSHSNPEM